MLIAVDAAGGDYAPHEVVKGAIQAAQEFNVDIALVGRRAVLHRLMSRHLNEPNLSIVEAGQVINFHEAPVKAVRTKLDSSIVVGINLVKNDTTSAFVSAGNTGAVFTAALFNMGKITNIERPAIASILHFNSSPLLLIDAGANVNCRPRHLVQFARLGNIYAREVLGINSPRVGLLSNGEEETKGNLLVKEAHKRLKKTNLNFIGNVEGQDVSRGTVDVIVTDGFTGNIILKALEGLGERLHELVWQLDPTSAENPIQGRLLMRMVDLGFWAKKMDYREYGGGCLLGVNGNVIIAHGRSQAKAIKNAIGLAKQTVEKGISRIIREENYEQTD
jgi:glycerol-3-phosphate acyltransferase PlsX